MDVFDLSAKISLDTSEYSRGLDNAGDKTSRFGDILKANLASEAVMKGVELLVTGVSRLAGALPSAISELADYGDNIDKMSQKMGMSAEAYQEWDAVMQHSGTSMESLKSSFKTLSNAIAGPTEAQSMALKNLGIGTEIYAMSTEDAFNLVVSKLQEMDDGARRTAIAQDLLGKGAMELGALFNTSAEDTQAMKDRVHELNGVMSDESVKAAARYKDSLQDLQTAIGGAKRTLVEGFLPSVSDIMDGLTDVIAGTDVEGGMAKIDAGINAFVEQLETVIPRIIEILDRIMPVILENLPKILDVILPALIDILTQLAVALVKALPSIVKALVEAMPDVVMALGEAIMEAAPVLLEAAAELVATILMGLMEGIAQFVKLGAELVMALGRGIRDKVGEIVDRIREIGTRIKEGIMDAVNRAKEWGADLVGNFIKGITGRLGELWDRVKSIGQGIRDFLGFSEPKKGPLSNFHTYAPDMMKLFAQGIRDNEHLITDQIARSFDFGIAPATGGARVGMAGETFTVPRSQGPQVLNVILELDRQQFGRVVYQLNEAETQRVGTKLAGGYA